MIPFNRPYITDEAFAELNYFKDSNTLWRARTYSAKCVETLVKYHAGSSVRLTKSCTQALELSSLLLNIQPGDEIIMPSYAYVSIATAFAQRGATLVYVDIDPDTLNIDPEEVMKAITLKTKGIIAINYSGIGVDYDTLLDIASPHGIPIIEDNAMGLYSFYKDKPLGTLGHIATTSFDYLKNISCGEGGAIFINDAAYLPALDVIYENGTNKTDFLAGKIDKYEWTGLGSNYYLSELLSCILFKQLDKMNEITHERRERWHYYQKSFLSLHNAEKIELLRIPPYCVHNGHNFIIKTRNNETRTALMQYLRGHEVESAFHYTPLHSSLYGQSAGRFAGQDTHTTRDSGRLLRLPLFYGIDLDQQDTVINLVHDFLK